MFLKRAPRGIDILNKKQPLNLGKIKSQKLVSQNVFVVHRQFLQVRLKNEAV